MLEEEFYLYFEVNQWSKYREVFLRHKDHIFDVLPNGDIMTNNIRHCYRCGKKIPENIITQIKLYFCDYET